MTNILIQIESVFGAALLTISLLFQACFFVFKIDTGLLAQIQNYSVWSASIAVIGHIINAFGAYDPTNGLSSSGSNTLCLVEAVTGTFGELALVLWQICTAIVAITSMYPDWIREHDRQRNMFIAFHIFVWAPSLVTTIIPWSQGILGFNNANSYDGTSYWCFFSSGHAGWEIGQFYVPLYISCSTSIIAFSFLVWKVREMAASVAGTKGDAAHKEQRVLFTRLAAQLFLLTVFFFPDSVSYFLNQYDPSKMPKFMFQATTVVWKAESWCIALLWFSNPRVREGIRKIPWLKSCFDPVDADIERRRSTSHSATVTSRKTRFPPVQTIAGSASIIVPDEGTIVSGEVAPTDVSIALELTSAPPTSAAPAIAE